MSGHTPGPWSVWPGLGGGHSMVTDDRLARHITYMASDSPEAEANARLIAAAPTMYEAINAALFEWPEEEAEREVLGDTYRGLRAAIAKAEA